MVRVIGFLLISICAYGMEPFAETEEELIKRMEARPQDPLQGSPLFVGPSKTFSIHWFFEKSLKLSTMNAKIEIAEPSGRYYTLSMDSINPGRLRIVTFETPLPVVLFSRLTLTLYYQIGRYLKELNTTLFLKEPEETRDLKILLSKKNKKAFIKQAALGPLDESLSTRVQVKYV